MLIVTRELNRIPWWNIKEVILLIVTRELGGIPRSNKRGYPAHSHKGVKQDPVVE